MARLCICCGHEIEEGRPGATIGSCEQCYERVSGALTDDDDEMVHVPTSRVIDFFEGRLDARDSAEVSSHLDQCDSCRRGIVGYTTS